MMALWIIASLAIIAAYLGSALYRTERELDDALDEVESLRRALKHIKWAKIDRDYW